MKLAFKNWSFGFHEKDIPIILKIGTLEDVCKVLGIDFWQISDTIKSGEFDFNVELLYQGYLTACKESFKKPKYQREKAIIWVEYMSQESQKQFSEMIKELFGSVIKAYREDKKKVKKK